MMCIYLLFYSLYYTSICLFNIKTCLALSSHSFMRMNKQTDECVEQK
jgi:hypothetical protein